MIPAPTMHAEVIHGVTVADPWRWLEDPASPAVAAWLADQHAAARRHLDALETRPALRRRLRELYYLETTSPAYRAGHHAFYTRTHAGSEMAVLYCRDESGTERVLLDPNALGGTVSLGAWLPSPDGRTLAFALHDDGADEAALRLMDVASGEVRASERINGAGSAPSWTPDCEGFYYTRLPTHPAIPADRRLAFAEVRFHRLGTEQRDDQIVRERSGNSQMLPSVQVFHDGRWLVASERSFSGDAVFYRDLHAHDAEWSPLIQGVEAHFSVQAWDGAFIVVSDHEAPRGRILRAEPEGPHVEWHEIVAQDPEKVLAGVTLAGGRLVLTWVREAVATIEVRTLSGDPLHRIALPSIGSTSAVVGSPRSDEAYVQFSSFLHPPEVLRLSVATGRCSAWSHGAQQVDPSPFTLDQVRYPSRDATLVPMFLVHRRDLALDGTTPFLLTGYGGFGVSMQPVFDPSLYPWLEAGGGVAVAGVRGGGEYGQEWHHAGVRERKQNSIGDFIAAAEYLIARGYTNPARLAIQGGSNGGLLVAAALTQRPDLFAAGVCADPLLDMLRYHLFGHGRAWVPEYGCADDPDAFGWLYAYSPYHRVRPGTPYPPVIFAISDSDDRVDPLHARKMAAALQHATSGRVPVLLRIADHAGHGGAPRLDSAVETWTDIYAFLFDVLGMSVS